MATLDQRTRIVFLGLYIGVLLVASKVALDSWYPPSTSQGLWFFAGLAALLLGNLIITPFFTRPADAISYAASGLVALLAVNVATMHSAESWEKVLWWVLLAYLTLILAASFLAIVLRGSKWSAIQILADASFQFATQIGEPRAVYSAIFFFAVIVFHRESTKEFTVLLAAGFVVVAAQPLERAYALGVALWHAIRGGRRSSTVGEILARQEPGVMLARLSAGAEIKVGDLVTWRGADDEIHFGLLLDRQWLAGETWLRIARVVVSNLTEAEITELGRAATQKGAVAKLTDTSPKAAMDKLRRNPLIEKESYIVGIVAPDTDLNSLVFEVTTVEEGIEEGRLVETRIGNKNVLYQLIAGVSREEILQQRNSYGYARARARKIGTWSEDRGAFEHVRWIPLVNEPVLLVGEADAANNPDAIGHFPGTSYPIKIRNLNDLVTHNAAILGILGVGKTVLALELIHRMRAAGIKVLCLDITGQYPLEFPGYPETTWLKALREKTGWGRTAVMQNPDDGGGVREFRAAMKNGLTQFVSASSDATLLVVDPGSFDVYQQDNRPFQGNASMSVLTPTQVARIVTELCLEQVQAQGMTDKARVCIVFEEAHSLVPEWNSTVNDGDRAAVNGTAKAILQGRKYGLGCLLITQRTANVTKTILNQCNTIFAMRTYDATGLEFLRNYIGDDFAGVLSGLEDRHAVIFGRASSCADPVLVRLNDRTSFEKAFLHNASEVEVAGAAADEAAVVEDTNDNDTASEAFA